MGDEVNIGNLIDWQKGRSYLREGIELGKRQLNLTLSNGAEIIKEGGKEALDAAKWARDAYHSQVIELDRNQVNLERFKINAQRINETLETMLATIANKLARSILQAIIDGVKMLVEGIVSIIKP